MWSDRLWSYSWSTNQTPAFMWTSNVIITRMITDGIIGLHSALLSHTTICKLVFTINFLTSYVICQSWGWWDKTDQVWLAILFHTGHSQKRECLAWSVLFGEADSSMDEIMIQFYKARHHTDALSKNHHCIASGSPFNRYLFHQSRCLKHEKIR